MPNDSSSFQACSDRIEIKKQRNWSLLIIMLVSNFFLYCDPINRVFVPNDSEELGGWKIHMLRKEAIENQII